jgi:hypothetical protein
MEPSQAEVARTLAWGLLPAQAHVSGHPAGLRVRHATGADGAPLLLARTAGDVATALRPAGGETHAALVLRVDDVVPVPGAPWRGRLWLAGWARRLDGDEARDAAVGYVRLDPTSDLLDVGRGHTLYRMEVADVRIGRAGRLVEVDVDDYRAAEPDPLHRYEGDLLAELAEYRGDQLVGMVSRHTGAPAAAGWRAVRVDRYGLVLAPRRGRCAVRRIRIPFPRPVDSVPSFAAIMSRGLIGNANG